MLKPSRSALAVVALLSSALAPQIARAQALPPASEIIAKYVAAIGGKDAIMKVTSIKQVATMDVPAVGMSATMEMFAAAPNKLASKTSIPGLGEMQNGFDGTVGWDMNPMQGPRVLTDKELTTMADNADFYASMLYTADRFSTMETVGDTTVAGEKAYKVKLVKKNSKTESTSFFSATSGLLLGSTSTQETQMGTMTMTQIVSDYKAFDGLKFPTKLEQTMGPQSIKITIKELVVNGAPASAFAVPEQIKPLIKK
ncbi:MAG: hypothetical protein WCK74_01535 [Gemmatimonadaceae bacterium]